MGGGSSKEEKTITVNAQAPKGPSQKPNIDNAPPVPPSKPLIQNDPVPSPALSKTSKMSKQQSSRQSNNQLSRQESHEGMINEAKPSAVAKQFKQSSPGAQQPTLKPQLPPAAVISSPAIEKPKAPKGNDQNQERRQATRLHEDQALRQKQLEEEKMKQLRIIAQQNKAKKAAEAAAAAQRQQNQRVETNGSEYFAQHNSPSAGFSQGGQGLQINGASKVGMMHGGLNITGQGMKLSKNDSLKQIPSAVAPAAFHFKVVNYEDKKEAAAAENDHKGYNYSGNYQGNGGYSMNPQEFAKDSDVNRNIDMNELHALLGN